MVASKAKYFLSPSALDDFRRCARCFFLDKVKKIKKPRGIFPSLPSGMDRVIKSYCDQFRLTPTLPPEFAGKIPGRLWPDIDQLRQRRDWRATDLGFIDQELSVKFTGAIDDLALLDSGAVAPLDYKTRGSALTEDKNPAEYYQNQLDCYALMLQRAGHTVSDKGFLTYWTPASVMDDGAALAATPGTAMIRFDVAVYGVTIDPNAAVRTLTEAVECLDGELPEDSPECETCAFVFLRARAVIPASG